MISIVMAYFNRKKLLFKTLKSIAQSRITDREIIVVDDGSSDEERLDDFIPLFPELRLIRIDPAEKNHTNSCIPYNLAIDAAQGEVVIIQNPECIHMGDILSHVLDHLDEGVYLSYAAYSADMTTTSYIQTGTLESKEDLEHIRSLLNPISLPTQADGTAGWYNHPLHKPKGYHFCSAIRKSDLDELGGFDERFAQGIAYDDDELLARIKRYGLVVRIPEEPYVIHQFHGKSNYWVTKEDLVARNKNLYYQFVLRETGWKAHRGIKEHHLGSGDAEHRANSIFERLMQGRPWVAVNMPPGDSHSKLTARTQPGVSEVEFINRIVELNPSIGIYLIVDDSQLADDFKIRFGARLLWAKATRTPLEESIHTGEAGTLEPDEEEIIDTLIATRCQYFIGNNRLNLSQTVARLRAWPQGFMFLFGEPPS